MNEIKTCVRCGQSKLITEFNMGSDKDGHHTYCRACQQEYERHYWHNRKGRKERWYEKHRAREERNLKVVLAYLLEHPCVDCGERDPLVLEFDHVRGEKAFNVSDGVKNRLPVKRLLEEIEKCEVRCVNCHLRKTAHENDYWILQYIE